MKSLGIDIGSSSIKIVEMQTTSKGFQVTHFYEHALNVAPGSDQSLEIIEILRDFTSHYDAAQTRFNICLAQDHVAIRNKFFPFNDRIKISRSLAFELEEDLPLSSDNAIFDAKIVRTIGNGAEVLACAAPKHHVKKVLERAHDSGFEPHIISAEGIAFANIFERWDEAPPVIQAENFELSDDNEKRLPRHVNLVLNIGHSRTVVAAFEGSSLIAVRSILWGGKNIAEALVKKYEIPFLDAMKEMKTKAFILTNKQGATFDQVTFSDTIAKSVREMARDLQLSILDLKGEFNAQIHNISLTGGVSQIQNLGPFLTQLLEAPVNKASVLELVPNILFDRSGPNNAKAGLALGLAIEGLKKPRNPALNFLRGDFAKDNKQWKILWNKWGSTIKVATAALLVVFVYSSLRTQFSLSLADRSQDALQDQAKTAANLRGKNASEAGIKKYIRENKKRASDLKALSGIANMNSALDILKKINDATPGKSTVTLNVKNLKIIDNQVRLEGFVKSGQELSILQQALTNISSDGKVNRKNSTLRPSTGQTPFSFDFKVDRGIQKVTR